MSKLKRIGMGISKKTLPIAKKELSKQGYKGLTSRRTKGGYYNLFYKSYRKKR